MSIKYVKALRELRIKLESYTWSTDDFMSCVHFSEKKDDCVESRLLNAKEDELLESVLFNRSRRSVFPLTVGLAVKKLVMLRINTAIDYEARKARAEAREVLDILGDE